MNSFSAIGLMSGTSLDGMDAVWIQATPRGNGYTVKVRGHLFRAFPRGWAETARNISKHDQLRAGIRYGAAWSEFAARLVLDLLKKKRGSSSSIDVIGAHGQTVVHLPQPKRFLGESIGITIQLADLSRLAIRTGITVVGNFRTADIAAGGEGAPLAPAAHRLLFGEKHRAIAVQNFGGIGNVTLLRNSSVALAFDTGPGNVWIDTVARWRTGKPMDKNGALARRGVPDLALARKLLSHSYFRKPPPKSAGWEDFGETTLLRHRPALQKLSAADAAATVTYATVEATARAYEEFVFPVARPSELIVSGGGAKNAFLLLSLSERLPWLKISTSEQHGIPVDQLEAVAFALLGIETLRGRPSNEPKATGARSQVICGEIAPHGQRYSPRLG